MMRFGILAGIGCLLALGISWGVRVHHRRYVPPAVCSGDAYDQFVCLHGQPDESGIDRSGRLAETLVHRQLDGRVPLRWMVYKRAKLQLFFSPTDRRPSKSLPVRYGRRQLGWDLSTWRDTQTGALIPTAEMAARMLLNDNGL